MAENILFQKKMIKSLLGEVSDIRFDNSTTASNEDSKMPTDVWADKDGENYFFQFKNINTTNYATNHREKTARYDSSKNSFKDFLEKFENDKTEFNINSKINLLDPYLIEQLLPFKGITIKEIIILDNGDYIENFNDLKLVENIKHLLDKKHYFKVTMHNKFGVIIRLVYAQHHPFIKNGYLCDFLPAYTSDLENAVLEKLKVVDNKYSDSKFRKSFENFEITWSSHHLVMHTHEYCCYEELLELQDNLINRTIISDIFSKIYITYDGLEYIMIETLKSEDIN